MATIEAEPQGFNLAQQAGSEEFNLAQSVIEGLNLSLFAEVEIKNLLNATRESLPSELQGAWDVCVAYLGNPSSTADERTTALVAIGYTVNGYVETR